MVRPFDLLPSRGVVRNALVYIAPLGTGIINGLSTGWLAFFHKEEVDMADLYAWRLAYLFTFAYTSCT